MEGTGTSADIVRQVQERKRNCDKALSNFQRHLGILESYRKVVDENLDKMRDLLGMLLKDAVESEEPAAADRVELEQEEDEEDQPTAKKRLLPKKEAKRQKVLEILREDATVVLHMKGYDVQAAEAHAENLQFFGIAVEGHTCDYCGRTGSDGDVVKRIWCRVDGVHGHVYLCLERKACRERRWKKADEAINTILKALGDEQ